MLTVKVSLKSKLPALTKALTGPPMVHVLEVTGQHMVANTRKAIIVQGKASGSFAQLSGWNQGARAAARTRNAQRKGAFVEQHASSKARDKTTAKHGVSRHAGYARQKERDHDEGKIPYSENERLRRTGQLVESLVGVVVMEPNRNRVELHATGSYPSGALLDDVLLWLAEGTPKMPARNPTSDMRAVEERFAERLRALVASIA